MPHSEPWFAGLTLMLAFVSLPPSGGLAQATPTVPPSPSAPSAQAGSEPARDLAMPDPEPSAQGGTGPAAAPPSAAPTAAPETPLSYGATAEVAASVPATRRVPLHESRDLPGAFGDPLRVIEALPGIVPITNGLPYVYARGAPPTSQGTVFHGLLLPQLFHVALGPSIIHPRMTGPLHLDTGVPDAWFGRHTGGLVEVEAAPLGGPAQGEVELRLIDVNGFLEVPVGEGSLAVAGRYGYPGPALRLFSPETTLSYWDAQIRYQHPLSERAELEVLWIGSFDHLDQPPWGTGEIETTSIDLRLQRLDLRLTHRPTPGEEVGLALTAGQDHSALGEALRVDASRAHARLWYQRRFSAALRLRTGGDFRATAGDLTDGEAPIELPEGALQVGLPELAEAPARSEAGAHATLDLRFSTDWELNAGMRADVWQVQGRPEWGVDPRLQLRWNIAPGLRWHLAAGLAHQPTVFLIPLPGLGDAVLDEGLTRALQGETGVSVELPLGARFESQAFVHHQDRLLLPELVRQGEVEEEPNAAEVLSYGLEVFVTRRLARAGPTGWLSYTLGGAQARSELPGLERFRPDFDVRHVINLVLSQRVWRGLEVGSRVHARSGRLIQQINPRHSQRLPWFLRLDLRLGYHWSTQVADLQAYAEWMNATIQQEYLDADCFVAACVAEEAPPISIPNAGIRATF